MTPAEDARLLLRLVERHLGSLRGTLDRALAPSLMRAHQRWIEERLPAMAAVIQRAIPGCEVRLFGSRARGQAGPDSDIDLLLYSHSECEARRHWRSHVIGRAYREGTLLHGPR